ncbi:PBECR4 domain-containing protein [Streptococcus sp. BJSWXB6CM1]|uniref:PBECR4 domain-containing protein n=1 Tax=Streptococcus fermentans TaxID=3095082 RepID=A0ABU5FVP1_9STRE|nr:MULTISPECIES: PBECR4 domain-containing protein [unclassified Streptococcus]MDY4345412.1 PBECR4 domain-containing protein [Streptococcus sp. BJSWXB5TM5]MDY4360203.1 PBECR4 domain-containing protein [Streptococcus sp. BJSWXB3CM3]MDY4370337.1 PBECR4 domain-containing protein [Streptococcus sp. BJSWXB6CM1]
MALSKEEAKRLSIISVADQLGIELKRTGSYSYTWTEHDSFVIDARKNEFHWNSRTEFGDVIQLVQTIRGVSYKEAMHFLETGEFKQVNSEAQMALKEPFHYNLERYENKDFSASRSYLKAQRGLSDDTINFFISQGSMAEATRKKGDYFEPVIVFKYKDNTGFLAGASLQGIVENRVHYPERGRLKQIMRNSDGQLGFSIDIGIPKRLVFAEAPIDLMSYYELHKDRLQDVRLVAMDGIKDGIISRRFMELYAEMNGKSYQVDQNAGKALETVARTTNYFKDGQNQDMITLAVDNDAAGHNFITRLQDKGIPVQIAIPPIVQLNQEKEDWNDFLKRGNETPTELAHVYTADEKSWHYQGFFEKEIALTKAQELTADNVKAFVSDRQLTREEVRQEYQTIINQERGRENTMSELYGNSSDHEDDLVNSHKQADRVLIQPETQDIIDSGEAKQWAKHPNIYFVKGLRFVALELTEEGKFEQSSQYLPKTEEEKEVVNKLLSKQKKQDEVVLEDDQSSELNIDTSNLSPEDAEWLKKNWNNISFSVEPKRQMVIDADKTVIFEKPSNPLGDDREPKKQIQNTEKTLEKTQGQLNDRASGGEGYSQPDAVGSAEPEAESSATFEQTVTSHPTSPYRYLHFSTNFEEVQRRQSKYHPVTPDDLKRMNQYAGSIQKSSQWYLEELANSKIYYFYSNNGEVSLLDVNFKRENFLHLTGIRPVVPGKNAGDFVVDFAEGRGDYNQILVSNSLKEKLQVIPMLEDILDPKSFVLDNLDEVRIAQRLNFSEAIKSKDEDFLLLFKDIGEERVPASLMKIKRDLRVDVEKTKEKVILGVFRERDGHIEQLSINENYVKDRGNELQTILKDGLFEEIKPDITKEIEQTTPENTLNKPILDSATFTQVLDTVYNLGVPGDISKTPKEFHQAWNQYLDYAKKHNDKFDQIVAAAGEDNLLDVDSDFYKEWQQDHIYKDDYHVRLQWSEERPDGPKLPFKETELISYQDFARELYKANQELYPIHQEGLKQVTGGHPEGYISPTKIQFSIYAPDGELIQDSIRYNIGEEINPIAHKERLSTREMREHPELMKIDGALFNQYHLERLVSELDISQFSYALEDTPYADQLLSRLPYGDLENSPIGFTDSSNDSRLGFISFDGMDSVEVENLSAWFEKLGVRDSPQEQVALVEQWQNEIKELSEKVEQTIVNVRDEFEKTQLNNSQNTLDNPYEKIYQYNRKDERDRDLDGDGISNSDEMLQGTDPYNAASNLHKKQEDRERRADVEVAAGAIITEAVATKSSEQTISQLVANKDTKALAEHLKEGMKNYLDSEQFRSFLDTMSKFHNYSLNNIHLLKMQNPNVSQVASFNKWKTDFERTVKKGSKALKIWVPYQVKTKISANQNELSFSPSENEMEEKEVTVTRFKLGNVFDVSQTEGKELPKAINELTGSVKDYEDLYRAAKAVSMDNQVSINFEEIKREGANGYYSPNENRIVISKGLKGQEHILKTIFHEMAHSDLHRGTNAQYGDDQYRKQELQAESVAYVVANHFGFDTSSYSFGYLAIWAKDKNGFEDMVEQLQIVQKEAKSLIDRMDAKLELVKNKSVKKDKFADKLQQAKEKSEQLGSQKAEAVKQVEEKKFLSSPQ